MSVNRRLVTHGYDDFYRHYAPFIRAFIARRVPAGSVEDLLAEVFVVAWRRRDDMPPSALPWLYRAARNIVGDSYRSVERMRALRERMASVPAEAVGDPGAIAADRALLVDALQSLGEEDREILLLAAWEGLDTPAIGEVFGITPGAASVRLHRARQRLEKWMAIADESPRRAGR